MSGISFTIKLNEADVANVKTMLRNIPEIATKVISRAINETLGNVKTKVSSEIRAVITAKKNDVDATFKITKATVTNLSANFQCTGKPLPLIAYSVNPTKTGVSVRLRKSQSRKVIPETFIATVRTKQQLAGGYAGHTGVFWRAKSSYKMPLKTPLVKHPRNPRGKIRVQRLQILQLFGPRIPDYLGDKGPIMANVLKTADDFMHKNINDQLNYELGKL